MPERTTENILYAYAKDSLYTYAHAIAATVAAGANPFKVRHLLLLCHTLAQQW